MTEYRRNIDSSVRKKDSCLIDLLFACAAKEVAVYSNGFSFAKYDYIVIARDDNSAAYGLDVKLGNVGNQS